MSLCTSPNPPIGFVGSLTRFVDCQAEAVGAGAYAALATPGSTLSIVLTGFITILVALLGYNLMLGHAPSLRNGVATFAKVGIVLALATSWPAYSTLVYDVVVEGPDQLVAEIGRPTGVPGADGTLTARLDMADAALIRLSVLGPGNVPFAQQGSQTALPPFAGFNMFALGMSRIIFLVAAIGGLLLVRVVAGLMLALGPLFLAFLLFSNTRSLFEGWVRVIAGAAIGSIGVSIVLGLELLLLEPWLAQVVAQREAGEVVPGMPSELAVIMTLFSLLLIGVMFATTRLAAAFRLAPAGLLSGASENVLVERSSQRDQFTTAGQQAQERTRAAAVAESVTVMDRRDRSLAQARVDGAAGAGSTRLSTNDVSRLMRSEVPVVGAVRGAGRRNRARVSASAQRRDTHQ